MRIIEEKKLELDDLRFVPQRNTLDSRSQVLLEREFFFYHSPRTWKGIPIFCANMAAIAGFDMALALARHKICTALHKFFTFEELESFYKQHLDKSEYIWVTIGKSEADLEKIKGLSKLIEPNIVIDVPNLHLESIVKFCAKVRDIFPNSIIMGGNIIGSEMTSELILHGGLDIVKINCGTGAQCLTTKKTGVGYGLASNIIECSSTAHGLKSKDRHLGLICSDGGLKDEGDFGKAFGLGADFLMAGTFFSGIEENCGEWDYATESKIKLALHMYGMSSKEAQLRHYGEYKKYRASEGKSSLIPYKGTVDEVVQELKGSLVSTGTYIGAYSLKDFSKCAVFAKVK